MSLSSAEEASYSSKIDALLAVSDIQTVSAKKIRLSLQEGLSYDISHQKKAINDLIAGRFDHYTTRKERENASNFDRPPSTSPKANGSVIHKLEQSASPTKREGSSDLSDPVDNARPKKKPKRAGMDDDAAYAARLQAELNSTARPTRGGRAKAKGPLKKKTPKKKSATKITAEDDSDLDSNGDDGSRKTDRGGAFNKPMYLSQPLKDLLGEESLSRPKTVKGLWAYIKSHDLQNPNDKRQIICDDALRAVFKKDEVGMFDMNKILSGHLHPMDD